MTQGEKLGIKFCLGGLAVGLPLLLYSDSVGMFGTLGELAGLVGLAVMGIGMYFFCMLD